MEKDLISIQSRRVFDGYACKINLEDKEFNKSKIFIDEKIGFSLKKENLYLLNEEMNIKLNGEVVFFNKEQFETLKTKIERINTKYGKCDWWRAKIGEECYYYLEPDLIVVEEMENDFDCDIQLYRIGNYFKTKDEALGVASEIKKLLKKHQDRLSECKKIISMNKFKEGLTKYEI